MTAEVACRTCGGEPRAGARFCDACGAPIASTQPSAEYRQVTVLFADVVRSMDIASTLDAERLRELMAQMFERSAAVVLRYGGTVSQFTGDGIMAVFGAPTTLEDHAFRACLAALDIQSTTRQLAADVQRCDGITLQLRIGLNSGQVIAGEIGSSAAGYTTIGKQVGMAQRMESIAPHGGVMLGESTARLVENTVELGEPELVHVKGTAEAVPVVGMRFDADLLSSLIDDADVTSLIDAQLVDQVRFAPRVEYSFRHPLIRTVAYESQLKSDRAQLHQRLASAIESRASADENAALIAEHLEAAGDLRAAFGWHMRAATWSTWRNIASARSSWTRAQQVADRLADNEPDRMAMRIAPRTLLCANAYRVFGQRLDTDFDELRDLCATAGDERSLAIGMSGLLMAWQMTGRGHETPSLNLADELTRLLDSIGDPTLTVGLSVPPMSVWLEVGQFSPVLTMAQLVIDYADGDLGKGRMLTISPLTTAVAYRGLSRALMGLPGSKDDFATAIAAADAINPAMRSGVIWIARMSPIANGVLLPDAIALRHTAEILAAAEQFGDNLVLDTARAARGITLSYCEGPEREEGRRLLTDLGEATTGAHVFFSNNLSVVKVHLAREKALIGDCDSAVDLAREGLDGLFANRQAEWTARGPPNSSSRSYDAAPMRTFVTRKRLSTDWLPSRSNPGSYCTIYGCCACAL